MRVELQSLQQDTGLKRPTDKVQMYLCLIHLAISYPPVKNFFFQIQCTCTRIVTGFVLRRFRLGFVMVHFQFSTTDVLVYNFK